MALTATDIDARISQINTILATILASPQPDYTVDGETVSWDKYKSSLIKDLEALMKLRSIIGGAWEVRHRGR